MNHANGMVPLLLMVMGGRFFASAKSESNMAHTSIVGFDAYY